MALTLSCSVDANVKPVKSNPTFRVENVSSLEAEGVDGRAKGTVRSKAEPWNERRVKNVSPKAKPFAPGLSFKDPEPANAKPKRFA